jgi:alcohol dehydrogenase class IV
VSFGLLRSPRNVVFGSGQRAALGSTAASLGKRAFVCTDQRMSGDVAFKEMMQDLRRSGIEVKIYDGTLVDVPIALVQAAASSARDFQPDMIIGIGGGSCLDLAKAAALIYSQGGDIRDYYGEGKVLSPTVPVIAVPTTAGTGSEVTPVAVLSDPDRLLKVGVSSAHLIPVAAICDPELTLTCPKALTAISGADALTHAIEAFTAIRRPATPELSQKNVFVGKNSLSDHFAKLAVQLIFRHLGKAYVHGSDIEAREGLMLGSLAAGLAFGTAGTALAHALQYPLGALTHTSHGEGVAVLLPYVMEFNRSVAAPLYVELAGPIGLAPSSNEEWTCDAVIDAVADLFAAVGIRTSLADMGLAAGQTDRMARESLSAARLINNNPRLVEFETARRVVGFAHSGDRTAARRELRAD